jgi:type IV pilus assembly protein PilV
MTVVTTLPATNRHRFRGQDQGFTLIEVLIAFVVLSVGVLGIISLLIMSKSSLHQSIQRTRAIDLADGIVERIRVNPAGLLDYIGSNPLGGATLGDDPALDCTAAVCTSAELAAYDLWAWEQALDGASITVDGANAGGLISPSACITFTALNGLNRSGMLNVIIQWRGLSKSSDAVQVGETVCDDDGAAAGADDYRRQVVVNTLVLDEAEF